jgi:hypothetical protein
MKLLFRVRYFESMAESGMLGQVPVPGDGETEVEASPTEASWFSPQATGYPPILVSGIMSLTIQATIWLWRSFPALLTCSSFFCHWTLWGRSLLIGPEKLIKR